MTQLHTPVLLVAFRRPDLTACVFERIRQAMPTRLYISVDGASTISESVMVKQVIKTIKVDWECEVFWKLNTENLGCRVAVSSAISWFFNHESAGIILEDDCLPDPTFFSFCEKMLDHYRYDTRVGHISGSSFVESGSLHSHYFSRYGLTWGWASWARVWQDYDPDVKDFRSLDYKSVSPNVFERIYWYEKFSKCANGLNTWDYQLAHLMFKYNYLGIVPTKNLVTNIGFNKQATHWNLKNRNVSNLPTTPVEKVSFPMNVERDVLADELLFKKIFNRLMPSNILHLINHLLRNGLDHVIAPAKWKRKGLFAKSTLPKAA